MDLESNVCPIWHTPADGTRIGGMAYAYDSNRTGGPYSIDYLAANQMSTDARFRARLTTWLVDQRRAGDRVPDITSATIDLIPQRAGLMLSQRIERFFLYLSSLRFRPGQKVYVSDEQGRPAQLPAIMAWIEAENHEDANGLLELLASSKLITRAAPGVLELSPEGFYRLELVETTHPSISQAFVAMWFGDEMNEIYSRGFEPAIRDSGYTPLRIDHKEHSNKIDDEIVREIRRSRFIVADFTCGLITGVNGKQYPNTRGGVYYEAGLAQGLDIPVISTIKHGLVDHVHFDTRQFAHITWTSAEDLRERLRIRIGAVIR